VAEAPQQIRFSTTKNYILAMGRVGKPQSPSLKEIKINLFDLKKGRSCFALLRSKKKVSTKKSTAKQYFIIAFFLSELLAHYIRVSFE